MIFFDIITRTHRTTIVLLILVLLSFVSSEDLSSKLMLLVGKLPYRLMLDDSIRIC